MDYTINCTRVPIPEGTTLHGTPLELGPAPAFSGPASDQNVLSSSLNEGAALNLSRRVLPEGEESGPISTRTRTAKHKKQHTQTTQTTHNNTQTTHKKHTNNTQKTHTQGM